MVFRVPDVSYRGTSEFLKLGQCGCCITVNHGSMIHGPLANNHAVFTILCSWGRFYYTVSYHIAFRGPGVPGRKLPSVVGNMDTATPKTMKP